MIYDISEELLTGSVYPGDPEPKLLKIERLDQEDECNLSGITACLHNGTHIDAPAHFIRGGATIEELDLETLSGKALVASFTGEISEDQMRDLLKSRKVHRLLIKGKAHLSADAARYCVKAGIRLLGTEVTSVDYEHEFKEDESEEFMDRADLYPIHQILLGAGCLILENVVLARVPDGSYELEAYPINIAGAEASLVRAVLKPYHQVPKMTTLCYIRRGDDYLMLLRNKKKDDINEGKWIGVGGKAEALESPNDCVIREAYEETGLTLVNPKLRGIITFLSDEWEAEYMMLYEADQFTGELTSDCPEGTLKWIPREEIGKLNLWDGDRIFLKELLETDHFINLKLQYEGDILKKATHYGA